LLFLSAPSQARFAGPLAERIDRRMVRLTPLLDNFAPLWGWIVVVTILLGFIQGLTLRAAFRQLFVSNAIGGC
jgi:hypothetical protein